MLDGGAKRKGNISLNEILHKGPKINPNLFDLLLRFRSHPIAITTDIEKAYLQIDVNEGHRDYLRFLRYADIDDVNSEMITLRFCRVKFGISPAQYLLNVVIQKHGEKYEEEEDPQFAKKVKNDFSVDDLTTGVRFTKEGYELY